jgi:hypothetical protein
VSTLPPGATRKQASKQVRVGGQRGCVSAIASGINTREVRAYGDLLWRMFLRCREGRSLRRAGRYGVLPLSIMPFVVWGTGECFHTLET